MRKMFVTLFAVALLFSFNTTPALAQECCPTCPCGCSNCQACNQCPTNGACYQTCHNEFIQCKMGCSYEDCRAECSQEYSNCLSGCGSAPSSITLADLGIIDMTGEMTGKMSTSAYVSAPSCSQ